jgi:hypothetical protein
MHDETFSVIAMRVGNKDRSPFTIHGCDAAPTPSGLADVFSDAMISKRRDSCAQHLDRRRLKVAVPCLRQFQSQGFDVRFE